MPKFKIIINGKAKFLDKVNNFLFNNKTFRIVWILVLITFSNKIKYNKPKILDYLKKLFVNNSKILLIK